MLVMYGMRSLVIDVVPLQKRNTTSIEVIWRLIYVKKIIIIPNNCFFSEFGYNNHDANTRRTAPTTWIQVSISKTVNSLIIVWTRWRSFLYFLIFYFYLFIYYFCCVTIFTFVDWVLRRQLRTHIYTHEQDTTKLAPKVGLEPGNRSRASCVVVGYHDIWAVCTCAFVIVAV